MSKKFSLFLLLAVVLGFSSCATWRIDKRHYNGGWYVDFGNNATAQSKTDHVNTTEETAPQSTVVAAEQPAIHSVLTENQNSTPSLNNAPVAGSEIVQPSTPATANDATAEPADNSTAKTPVAKQQKTESAPEAPAADVPLWALFILAIFIPPLAVFLKQGLTNLFWIDLICALLGGGFLFYPVFGGLFLVAVIIAILAIFDVI